MLNYSFQSFLHWTAWFPEHIRIFPAFYSVDRRATIPQVLVQSICKDQGDYMPAKVDRVHKLSIFLIDSSDMPSIYALAKELVGSCMPWIHVIDPTFLTRASKQSASHWYSTKYLLPNAPYNYLASNNRVFLNTIRIYIIYHLSRTNLSKHCMSGHGSRAENLPWVWTSRSKHGTEIAR